MDGKKAGLEIWVALTLMLVLIIIIIVSYYKPSNQETDNNSDQPIQNQSNDQKTYCTASQRNATICTQIYAPVCGWFDSSKVQCIKYPCATTYSNSCAACGKENVLYYTSGECPVN